MFGKGVDKTTGADICTAASGDACQAGTPGSAPGEFEAPTFVAVDGSSGASSGDVYVGDTGTQTVSKFDSTGQLIASWGTAGALSGFSPMYGIAVDPSGNLFILSSSAYWYEQSGGLHSTFGYPRGSSPYGLAVDAEDHLYKVDGEPEVTKFTDTGEELGEPDTGKNATGLTVDPSSNDLYVIQGGESINRFALDCGQACPPLTSFGGGHLNEARGASFNASDDAFYVANAGGGDVAVFDAVNLPDATSGPTETVGTHLATVSGHVNPSGAGNVTACAFEYVDDAHFMPNAPNPYADGPPPVPCSPAASPATPITAPTEVTAELTNLQANVLYHYRLTATSANGTGTGADETFTSTPTRPLLSTFNGSDSTAGAFSGHFGGARVAVNQADGDVLVMDAGKGVIDQFNASGEAQAFADLGTSSSLNVNETCVGGFRFTEDNDLAIDNTGTSSQGNIYVSDGGGVCAYNAAGHFLWKYSTHFESNCGLGVDSAGHVWIGESGSQLVKELGTVGSPPNLLTTVGDTSGPEDVCHLAFDSYDNLYMNQYRGQVDKYNSSGKFQETIDPGDSFAVAVDPRTGRLFVSHSESFTEYDTWGMGSLLSRTPLGNLSNGEDDDVGIAVNPASGNTYVASSKEVGIFGPLTTLPDATTGAASSLAESSATVSGHIDPAGKGAITECKFEYASDTAHDIQSAPCSPGGSLSEQVMTSPPTSLASNLVRPTIIVWLHLTPPGRRLGAI